MPKAHSGLRTTFSPPSLLRLSKDYDWKALGDRTIVDLGSGIGAQEMFLAPRYTNLHFICLDLPHVVEHGKEV